MDDILTRHAMQLAVRNDELVVENEELKTEIERLRAALRDESRLDQKRPQPPEDLVDALQDRVHPASGPLISSKPVLRDEEQKP